MPLDDITMQEGSWVTHADGDWYPGEIIRVEDGGDFGFGDTIRFVIVLDGEEENETWALASQKLSPKSKLFGWVKGIDPKLIPEIGQPFQYQKLEGRRVEVMFEIGDERERVSKIRSEKKAQAAPRGRGTVTTTAPRGSTVRQQVAGRAGRVVEDDQEAPF